MRKLIDGLAIASFVLSLTTVGAIGFGYLALTNKTNQEKIKNYAIGEAQSGESIVGTTCAAFQMSATTTQTSEGNVLWNGTNWSAGPDGGLSVGGHKGTGTANA